MVVCLKNSWHATPLVNNDICTNVCWRKDQFQAIYCFSKCRAAEEFARILQSHENEEVVGFAQATELRLKHEEVEEEAKKVQSEARRIAVRNKDLESRSQAVEEERQNLQQRFVEVAGKSAGMESQLRQLEAR